MSAHPFQNRDCLAGVLFMTFGAVAFFIARNYGFGTLNDMGPGYFPRLLSGLLVLLGAGILIRGVKSKIRESVEWAIRPLSILTLAMVLFGALIERVGLVPSMAVLITASAAAGNEFKLREVVVLAALMCLFAVVVFVWGLKMNYPLFAWGF